MSLGIVIPLKSRAISRDWQVTSAALAATLNSLAKQSSKQFRAVVVGHDIPDGFRETYPFVTFELVTFSPPDRNSPGFTHNDLIKDKNLKIARGLQVLEPHEDIRYWYELDSDDLLSNDFVSVVLKKASGQAGLIIDGGYIVYKDVNRAIISNDLSLHCGSTSVIAREYLQVPDELSETGLKGIPWGRYPHMDISKFFSKEIAQPYRHVTEPVLAYVLGSGDNISDKWRDSPWKAFKAFLKPYLKGKSVGSRFKEKFALK